MEKEERKEKKKRKKKERGKKRGKKKRGEKEKEKMEGEEEKILQLVNENNGYLPYHDKSDPEEVYAFFGMSKKSFKMATGALYKQKKIEFTKTGIKLLEG